MISNSRFRFAQGHYAETCNGDAQKPRAFGVRFEDNVRKTLLPLTVVLNIIGDLSIKKLRIMWSTLVQKHQTPVLFNRSPDSTLLITHHHHIETIYTQSC